MALATKCPHCNTIFRVAADQLKLRGGIVRCGSCHEVFDGNAALVEPAAKPTPVIPDVPVEPAPVSALAHAAQPSAAGYVQGAPVDFELDFAADSAPLAKEAPSGDRMEAALPATPAAPAVWRTAAAAIAQEDALAPSPDGQPSPEDVAVAAVARAFAAVTSHDTAPEGKALPWEDEHSAAASPVDIASPPDAAAQPELAPERPDEAATRPAAAADHPVEAAASADAGPASPDEPAADSDEAPSDADAGAAHPDEADADTAAAHPDEAEADTAAAHPDEAEADTAAAYSDEAEADTAAAHSDEAEADSAAAHRDEPEADSGELAAGSGELAAGSGQTAAHAGEPMVDPSLANEASPASDFIPAFLRAAPVAPHPDGRIEPTLDTPQEHIVVAALDDAHHFEDLPPDEQPPGEEPAEEAARDETALHAVAAVNADVPDDGESLPNDEPDDEAPSTRRERALKRAQARLEAGEATGVEPGEAAGAETGEIAGAAAGDAASDAAGTGTSAAAARMRALAGVDDAAEDLDHSDLSFVKRVDRSQKYGKAITLTMAIGIPLLLAGLVLQAATTFRDTLAASYPQLKPVLAAICQPLGCKIALPTELDALSVEPGELASMTETTFSYSTVLRNQSKTVQAWPHIELTLNDNADKPVLRRVFAPRDYLPSAAEAEKGFGPRSEQSIKLYFELKELKASGYHIAIFHP